MTAEVLTPIVQAQPRQIVNLRLMFANSSDTWQRIEPRLAVPGGWQVLVPAEQKSIDPVSSYLAIMTVLVPANAKAGSHTFPLTYYTSRDSEPRQVLFTVEVPVVNHAEIRTLESPELVTTSSYTARFLLQNLGNVAQEWAVSANSTLGGDVRVTPSSATLAPRESVELLVTVEVPRQLDQQRWDILTVDAQNLSLPSVKASARSRTALIPHALSPSAAFHTFPLTVRTTYRGGINASSHYGTSFEITGAGKLVENTGADFRVDLRLTADDFLDKLLLEYRSDAFSLSLGDQSFTTSLLTPQVNGFGVSTTLPMRLISRPLSLELAAYVSNESNGLAADFSMAAAPHTGLAMSLSATDPGILGSFEVKYKPNVLDPTRVQVGHVRVAFGTQVNFDTGIGHGVELEGRLNEGPSFVRLKVASSSASFEHTDSHLFSVGIHSSLRVNDALRIPADYPLNLSLEYQTSWRWDQNLPFFFLPPSQAQQQGEKYGLGIGFGAGPATLSASYTEEFDSILSGDRKSTLRGLATLQVPGGASVAQSAAWKRRTDTLGVTSNRLDYQTAAAISTWADGLLTASLTGSFDLLTREHDELAFGVKWQGRPAEGLRLQASGQIYLLHPNNIWSAEVASRYGFTNGHSLELDVNTKAYRESPLHVAFEVSYALPLEVPIGRKANMGELRGSVTNVAGSPVSGLVISAAGQAVVTDSYGTFTFPAMPAGEHLVQVQAGLVLTPQQVLSPRPPQKVIVLDRQTTTIDFVVVEGTSLIGSITVVRPESSDDAIDDEVDRSDLAQGVRLELRGEKGLHHSITDANGVFRFNHLLPGTWTLRVIHPRLPKNYVVEPAVIELVLRPGEPTQVEIEVIPGVRSIEFNDGGTLLLPSNP